MYLEAGGSTRFIENICKKIDPVKLAAIDQKTIDKIANQLQPSAKPSTLNRQVYTPISAIMTFSAKRGLCEYRAMQRPKMPTGRIRYLNIEKANKLINASSDNMCQLLVFLLYTSARVSETLHLNWNNVDLSRKHVAFIDTENGESRGVSLPARD